MYKDKLTITVPHEEYLYFILTPKPRQEKKFNIKIKWINNLNNYN